MISAERARHLIQEMKSKGWVPSKKELRLVAPKGEKAEGEPRKLALYLGKGQNEWLEEVGEPDSIRSHGSYCRTRGFAVRYEEA